MSEKNIKDITTSTNIWQPSNKYNKHSSKCSTWHHQHLNSMKPKTKYKKTPYSNHIASKQDICKHLISCHHHLFKTAILEGTKGLWEQEVVRGSTLYLHPDGNNSYSRYRGCDTSARIDAPYPLLETHKALSCCTAFDQRSWETWAIRLSLCLLAVESETYQAVEQNVKNSPKMAYWIKISIVCLSPPNCLSFRKVLQMEAAGKYIKWVCNSKSGKMLFNLQSLEFVCLQKSQYVSMTTPHTSVDNCDGVVAVASEQEKNASVLHSLTPVFVFSCCCWKRIIFSPG